MEVNKRLVEPDRSNRVNWDNVIRNPYPVDPNDSSVVELNVCISHFGEFGGWSVDPRVGRKGERVDGSRKGLQLIRIRENYVGRG